MREIAAKYPNVEFRDVIRAHGTLERGEAVIRVPSILLQRTKHEPNEPWELSAVVAADEAESARHLVYDSTTGTLLIKGLTDDGETILIRDLTLANLRGRELRVKVHEIDFGPEQLAETPTDQSVGVYLTPTFIAQAPPLRKTFGEGEAVRSLNFDAALL